MRSYTSIPLSARGAAFYVPRMGADEPSARIITYAPRAVVGINRVADYNPHTSGVKDIPEYGPDLDLDTPLGAPIYSSDESADKHNLLLTNGIYYDKVGSDTNVGRGEVTSHDSSFTEPEDADASTTDQSAEGAVKDRANTMSQTEDIPLIGLIASKNPVSALILTVQSMFIGGASRVIVVDDGSDDSDSLAIFDLAEEAGAEVIHLKENVGKSIALKSGFKKLPTRCIIVQTDDDTLAGNLSGPAQLIRDGKADIVDIRVETTRTHSLLGLIQELDYWLVNAVSKRIQDVLRARLWMSGASVMYSYDAGVELILTEAKTMTEDTEGLFRARQKGWKVRYYAKHDGEFLTMVPEDWPSLHKQWKRWAIGSGQVIGLYGMGAGNPRIATVNIVTWLNQIIVPVVVAVHYGVGPSLLWGSVWGILVGIVGSIRLKRLRVCWLGIFLPYVSVVWGFHAVQGLFLAYIRARAGTANTLTWVSPKRTVIDTVPLQA